MGKIAFVFAGQGAQFPGMGKDIYNKHDCVKEIFDRAGEDIKSLCFNGPTADLNRTVNTQPCLFTMDIACAALLNKKGIMPDGLAGFSLGEIPAAVFAGILNFEKGFEFVKFRAAVMDECAEKNKGAMYAVLKLKAEEVEKVCGAVEDVFPVNYNCPGQTVVAVSEKSAPEFERKIAEQVGKPVKLAVSGAFHSPFMNDAAEKIHGYLKDLKSPSIPLYSNFTGERYGDPKELLSKQVKSPVLWQKTIENMIRDGFDTFVEVGAGRTLSGLIKRIDSTVKIMEEIC